MGKISFRFVRRFDNHHFMPPFFILSGVIEVTQLAHRQRIDSVCALIKNGTYKIPPTYASAIRRPKGIVDNYHGVLYCDIGKTGTTSWLHFFKIMTANEAQKRRQWFNEHPYSWYSRRPRSKLR